VQPLVHALNGLLERLGRALAAQRNFIADAAHQLRTPLTAVHLQAQLAERATTDEERHRALADLRSGLERATRLSEQLLTLAREEPGVAERPLVNVDLSALAREVIGELALLAQVKGIDLGLNANSTPPLKGDPDALRSLVSNLVDNALRYTPIGGRVDVNVGTSGDGGVGLTVSDNGPGISLADRDRVFDRFYRGQAALGRHNAQGSGLGLAIVKSVAERHGAEVVLGDGLDGTGLSVSVRFRPVRG